MKKGRTTLVKGNKKHPRKLVATIKRHIKRLVSAFTITELLIVIAVIAILAAITIVSYPGIYKKAIVNSLRADLSLASKELKMFQVVNSVYPTTIDCNQPNSSTNLCIRHGDGTTFEYVSRNASDNAQIFCTDVTKGDYQYSVDQDGVVMAGPCPVLNLSANNTTSYHGVGNTWYDISGNNNDGQLNGADYTTQNGGALSFDGVDDYVSSSYVEGVSSNQITISSWIRPGSTNGTYEISNQGQWNTGPWTGWRFRQIGQTINFKLSDGSANDYECAGGSFNSNEWHYVVGVWDGSYIRIYVDGQEQASCAESFTYHGNSGEHSIGKYAGSSYFFNGLIGGIQVYDEALSAYEIFENYAISGDRYGL